MTNALYMAEVSHRHTRRCWWNHEKPGWVCVAAPAEPDARPPAGVREKQVMHAGAVRDARVAQG